MQGNHHQTSLPTKFASQTERLVRLDSFTITGLTKIWSITNNQHLETCTKFSKALDADGTKTNNHPKILIMATEEFLLLKMQGESQPNLISTKADIKWRSQFVWVQEELTSNAFNCNKSSWLKVWRSGEKAEIAKRKLSTFWPFFINHFQCKGNYHQTSSVEIVESGNFVSSATVRFADWIKQEMMWWNNKEDSFEVKVQGNKQITPFHENNFEIWRQMFNISCHQKKNIQLCTPHFRDVS